MKCFISKNGPWSTCRYMRASGFELIGWISYTQTLPKVNGALTWRYTCRYKYNFFKKICTFVFHVVFFWLNLARISIDRMRRLLKYWCCVHIISLERVVETINRENRLNKKEGGKGENPGCFGFTQSNAQERRSANYIHCRTHRSRLLLALRQTTISRDGGRGELARSKHPFPSRFRHSSSRIPCRFWLALVGESAEPPGLPPNPSRFGTISPSTSALARAVTL